MALKRRINQRQSGVKKALKRRSSAVKRVQIAFKWRSTCTVEAIGQYAEDVEKDDDENEDPDDILPPCPCIQILKYSCGYDT